MLYNLIDAILKCVVTLLTQVGIGYVFVFTCIAACIYLHTKDIAASLIMLYSAWFLALLGLTWNLIGASFIMGDPPLEMIVERLKWKVIGYGTTILLLSFYVLPSAFCCWKAISFKHKNFIMIAVGLAAFDLVLNYAGGYWLYTRS